MYDLLGNRTTGDGVSYTANNLNQYLAVGGVAQAYDANGNLTTDGTAVYSYDEENRLTQVVKGGVSSTYTYDAHNRRVSKTVGGVGTYYVHDGMDVAEERDVAGGLTADYVYGPSVDEPLAMTRGGSTYYYFTDGLGSVRNLTDGAGGVVETYDYDPYGKPTTLSTVGNPIMYTGRWYDAESGNYYYRARMYSPTIGRFFQRDPLGYVDSLNLYTYATNNPGNITDPYGLYGTNSCEYYNQRCQQNGGKYYCEQATYWCSKFPMPKDPDPTRNDDYEGWFRCTRQCLQDCDKENHPGNNEPDSQQCSLDGNKNDPPNDNFWDSSNFICHAKCYTACTNPWTAPKGK